MLLITGLSQKSHILMSSDRACVIVDIFVCGFIAKIQSKESPMSQGINLLANISVCFCKLFLFPLQFSWRHSGFKLIELNIWLNPTFDLGKQIKAELLFSFVLFTHSVTLFNPLNQPASHGSLFPFQWLTD